MVSNRCKMAVKEELKKLGLHFIVVDLGEVEIMENLSADKHELVKTALFNAGFELMVDLPVKLTSSRRFILTSVRRNKLTTYFQY